MPTSSTPKDFTEVQANAMVGWVELTAINLGWRVFRFLHPNPDRAIGPELMICRPGERLAVKVKTAGQGTEAKMTENQRADRDVLAAAGFEYHLWSPAKTTEAFRRLNAKPPPEPTDTPAPRTARPKKRNAGDKA